MHSPFDPENFEAKFSHALAPLCDTDTEIDCVTDESHTLTMFMTVDGVDFEVRITPSDFVDN